MRLTSIVTGFALWWAAFHAGAEIIVDQQTTSTAISGGVGTPVVQSFTPGADNIAAAEVLVSGTAAFENDLTIKVFERFESGVLSGLIVTGTAENVPRGTLGRVDFASPAVLTPGELYYLEFLLSNSGDEAGGFASLLGIGTRSSDVYVGGEILKGGGNLANAADAIFKTYTDTEFVVPEPASLALLSGVLLLGGRGGAKRQTDFRRAR